MSPVNGFPPPEYGPAIQQFILEKTRLGMRLPVDSYLVNSIRLHQYEAYESMFTDMVFQLEAYVLQDKLPPQTVRETRVITSNPTPATWWDPFKVTKLEQNRWYWRWLGKLKPPLMQADTKEVTLEVNLERWISYPEAQNIPDTFGNQYRGHTVEKNWWETSW